MDLFWYENGWEDSDPHLKKLDRHPFQREFPKLRLKKGLYIIRGPRQIGKTSWLKTILSNEVIERGAEKCFYLSCEQIANRKELASLLKGLRSYDVVILDEITYIKDWALPVKYEIDSGYSNILIITGSNTNDLRKGGEQLPGRFDHGGEFFLSPMDIEEFKAMRKVAKWKELTDLELIHQYFKIGGFPSALIEAGEKGKTPRQAKETYKKWLVGDFLKLGKLETYFKEIMGQLALTMGSTIGLQKLAQRTQMASHHTALEYIETLEDCFALRQLYAIDPDTKSFRLRKAKKFYFSDPLIFWVALELGGVRDQVNNPDEVIAEMVAHNAIVTRMKNDKFGYFSSRYGEIDFFCPGKWAIEVKWSEIPTNLSKAYLNHVSSWKTVWCKKNFAQEWPRGT